MIDFKFISPTLNLNKYFLIIFSLLSFISSSFTQTKDINISGFITDSKTGEALIGTNILLYKDSINTNELYYRGTASNSYGFYAITNLIAGKYILIFRHVGYKTTVIDTVLGIQEENVRINIELPLEDIRLEEIVISGKQKEEPQISVIDISPDILSKLPSLSGEVDLFKSLQYIPGVKAASELSSGLYVRGGSPDQTLTLVDGMIIYNPAHLGNFTTTFNSNALQDIRLIKGAFPAEYGGRLSSILDLKLRSGTKEKHIGTLGIGVINSNVLLEGPMSENSTYMLAGRGMYYDLFQKNFNKKDIIPHYHFYDMNAKFTYSFSGKDIFSISGMFSKDNLYSPSGRRDIYYDINWENGAVNLNWLQITPSSFFSNTSLSYISYQFSSVIENNPSSSSPANYFSSSKLQDFLLKKNFEFYPHELHTVKTGVELFLHKYNLLVSNFYNPLLELNDNLVTSLLSFEASLFLQDDYQITRNLKTNLGGRFYYFEKSGYFSFEPRVSLMYSPYKDITLKSAFASAHQFLHLITRNDITLPTDLWYPSTKKINPAKSIQYVVGADLNLFNSEYLFTVEGYYKEMKNLYEFRDDAKFELDDSIDELLTSGEGEAYGIEFFFNKRKGDFNGWIGYTLSWTKRLFEELNAHRIFYPRYDRRHDISMVVTYNVIEQLNIGLTWTYATGAGFTLPLGQYRFYNVGLDNSQDVRLNYTERNGYRLPDYHKMDLNVTYNFFWFGLPFDAYLNIYNLYNRNNSFAQYITSEDDQENPGRKILKLKQMTLFPFIPTAGIKISF
ncbi:MAG: TonB-dependent receptor [Ignavibacteriales bacterium]|nr:MAG: TonB-dependent receptor [Ignavibacteriales bacterium]